MRALIVLALVGCGSTDGVIPQDGGADLTRPEGDAAGTEGQPCDNAFTQMGCNPGLHCAVALLGPELEGADLCVRDVPKPIPAGEPCAPISWPAGYVADYCRPGTTCVQVSDLQGSRCAPLCFRHRDCPSGTFCAAATPSPTVGGFGGDQPLAACISSDACDPLAQTGCPDGSSCYFGGSDSAGRVLLCVSPAGSEPPASECEHQRDCAPGEACIGLGFCRALCYLAAPDCEPGKICEPFFGGGTTYGECE